MPNLSREVLMKPQWQGRRQLLAYPLDDVGHFLTCESIHRLFKAHLNAQVRRHLMNDLDAWLFAVDQCTVTVKNKRLGGEMGH